MSENTEKLYQPYSTGSGSYNFFNHNFYYCWRFNTQPHLFKSLKVVYKIDCVEKLEKKYKKIFENTVNVKSKDKLQTVVTNWAFEGDKIVVYIERTKLINSGVSEEDTDYDDDCYSDYSRDKTSKTVSVTVLYHNKKDLENILQLLEPVDENNKNNIFLITGNATEGFYLRNFSVKLPQQKLDLELNYGEEFVKKHNTIIERLGRVNDTGLVVLNGKPGTGKTTYIKFLTTLIDKKIIFVSPSLAESITTPNFLPFLLDNKNSVLIIEDAEKVVGSRESTDTNNGVSNILNMTDGILGDCLNIQVVATLNTPRDKIDPALLRKGRLIAEHEFKELPEDNVKRIFKKLKVTRETYEPMVLTDIYNHTEADIDKKEKVQKRLGF